MQDWWKTAFDDRYLSFYRPILTAERTRREVEFVRTHLSDARQILDVPCGYGRHSIALAQAGYLVTGIDYSQVMLNKAQHDAEKAGVGPNFVQADMQDLPFPDQSFDGAIMLFTSFGYLGREGDRKAIREIGRVLKQGGLFVLDQQNPWPAAEEAVQSGRKLGSGRYEISAPLWQYEGIERMVWDDHSHVMTIDETWNDENGTRQFSYRIQAYTAEELKELLADAGFTVQALYGDFDGHPHRPSSDRMIFVCSR